MPSQPSQPSPSSPLDGRSKEILNVRVDVAQHRQRLASLIDRIGQMLASPALFVVLLASHVLWVILNLPIYSYKPWDPYPFMFLATIASAEAPFIALLVLMRQQRDARIEELREELNLQVSFHLENRVTMALRLLDELEHHLQIQTKQEEATLKQMKEYLDPQALLEDVGRQLSQAEGDDTITP